MSINLAHVGPKIEQLWLNSMEHRFVTQLFSHALHFCPSYSHFLPCYSDTGPEASFNNQIEIQFFQTSLGVWNIIPSSIQSSTQYLCTIGRISMFILR